MNINNYITTKEVAKRLNKSISTIYRYVNEKKLRPVYEDKWQIDSSLLFREEDVERLLEEQQDKPGYTTGEVAAKLSKHPSTIAMYIKTGKLKTEKREYKGRIINFIPEEELKRIQVEIGEKETGYLVIYDKRYNIYLYQSFQNSDGNTARIMSLKQKGEAELEDGGRISINRLFQLGFQPVYKIKSQRYVTKKGYVQFRFRFRDDFGSNHLNIIESLILNMGEKNIRIREEEGGLTVLVKPGLLQDTQNILLSKESLYTYLISGSIIQRHDGILLQSNYSQILFHVKKDIKEQLKYKAQTEKMTLDEYLESILIRHLNEEI